MRVFSLRSNSRFKLSGWGWWSMGNTGINHQFVQALRPLASNAKKILLVDLDNLRRQSRVRVLNMAGYAVDIRDDSVAAERLDQEGNFDLIIVALHGHPEKAIAYSDHLAVARPKLPILLLTDWGVYVPPGSRSGTIETGDPDRLIQEIASRLEGSTHVRELPIVFGQTPVPHGVGGGGGKLLE
jgi:hypothetical protein